MIPKGTNCLFYVNLFPGNALERVQRVQGQIDDLKLVNEGGIDIVNLRVDGQLGTICADDFTLNEADVICRQLGFQYSNDVLNRQSFNQIVLFGFKCNGDENRISDCKFEEGQNRCSGGQAAGVRCYGTSSQPG